MKHVLSVLLILSCISLIHAQVAINNTGATPDPSAMLDVSSTTRGMLIPRMTTTERNAIQSPATSLMVFDTDLGNFYYYDGSAWQLLAGTSSTVVFESNNNVILLDTAVVDHTTHDFVFGALQLDDDGNSDHYNRLFFDKSKGAFRAGRVSNSNWDESNLGDYSVALGLNSIASGSSSTSLGSSNTASGDNATAVGSSNKATGNNSTAMGNNNTASGNQAVALGELNTASGTNAAALGYKNEATALYATAMGSLSDATGEASFAAGFNNKATGDYSFAQGLSAEANGDNSAAFNEAHADGNRSTAFNNGDATGESSTAFNQADAEGDYSFAVGNGSDAFGEASFAGGAYSDADGDYSFVFGYSSDARNHFSTVIGYNSEAYGRASTAIGHYVQANSYGEVALGIYNTIPAALDTNAWNADDRVFVVGNGTSTTNRSDALTVYKNGTMTINEAYSLPNQDGTAGQVLITDGNGTVSWQTPANLDNQGLDIFTLNNTTLNISLDNNATTHAVDLSYLKDGLGDHSATQNLRLNGNWISNDGDSEGIYVDTDGNVAVNTTITNEESNVKGDLQLMAVDARQDRHGNTNGLGDYGTEVNAIDFYYPFSGSSVERSYARIATINYNTSGTGWYNITSRIDAGLSFYVSNNGNMSRALELKNNGNATLSGTLTQNSDRRLKTNIQLLGSAMPKLMQLNGYTYNWKAEERDQNTQIGLIAQEVQAIYPELVSENETGTLSVNYVGLVPVLLESTKEQQHTIEDLEARVRQLAAQNEALKAQNEEVEALKAQLDDIQALLQKQGIANNSAQK